MSFDAAGNVYGTTANGGTDDSCFSGCGTIFEITPSNGGWTENIIFDFLAIGTGYAPTCGLVFDGNGNLYGTASGGGAGYGTVYELTRSGSSWSQTVLYNFHGQNDGGFPYAGLLLDGGNLYGAAAGINVDGGPPSTAFELSPNNGNWDFQVLSVIPAISGPFATPTMDAAGNLYDTTAVAGPDWSGTVFKLTPSNGSWIYTGLYAFGLCDTNNGCDPTSGVVIDAAGNLYGTAQSGGNLADCGGNGCGVVWEITP